MIHYFLTGFIPNILYAIIDPIGFIQTLIEVMLS